MSERENFLSRWSRRKQAVAEAETKTALVETDTATDTVAEEEPFDPATLPSLESLTSESDFSPFLRRNVPEVLRNAALRRLWALDPHLQGPDVLADYAWDFNSPDLVTGFGELAEGTDTAAMLRWIRGEERPPGAMEKEASDAASALPAPPPALGEGEGGSPDSAGDDAMESDAASQHQSTEIREQFGHPGRSRRHGGALPNCITNSLASL